MSKIINKNINFVELRRKPLLVAIEELWGKYFGKENEGISGLEMFKYEHLLRLFQKLIESYWYEREEEFIKELEKIKSILAQPIKENE